MKTYTPDVQPTPAELFRIEMECTDAEVIDVTGINEADLFEMKVDLCLKWIEQSIGCNDDIRQNFIQDSAFWGFWKQQWYNIDREFLASYYKYYFNNPISWYLTYHDTKGHMMNTDRINAAFHSLIKTLAVKR